MFLLIIWVKWYSITFGNIEFLSSLSGSGDRTAWWMMVQKSACGRKPFWFHHLLNMNRLDLWLKELPFIFFRSCSIGSSYWLLSPHFLSLFPAPDLSRSLLHLNAQPLCITPSSQRGDAVMTTKVLPECLLGKLTFPEVLPLFNPSPC